MKTDDPGFLDIKLVIVAVAAHSAAWLDAITALGDVESETEQAGWQQRRVRTSAKLGDRVIRVTGFVGPPTADAVAAYVGADRLVSDGSTEIPEVSIANPPRVAGPAARETLLGAVKEILRDASRS